METPSSVIDIKAQRYLVCLKYWTSNLGPLVVYPDVLSLQIICPLLKTSVFLSYPILPDSCLAP